jgi:hypothetical protein
MRQRVEPDHRSPTRLGGHTGHVEAIFARVFGAT